MQSCLERTVSERSDDDVPADAELREVARRLAREVKLRDRIYRLREYKCCFKGSDAVRALLESGTVETSEDAVRLGNRLREHGFVRHITNAYTFENKENYYYWFHESIIDSCECQSSSSYRAAMLGWRGTVASGDFDVGSELNQLQRMVHGIKSELQSALHERTVQAELLAAKVDLLEERLEYERTYRLGVMGLLSLSLALCTNLNGLIIPIILIIVIYLVNKSSRAAGRGPERCDRGTEKCEVDGESENDVTGGGVSVKLEDFENWPDCPCLLYAPPSLLHPTPRRLRLNTGIPFAFETELFSGEAVLWIDHISSTPPSLFTGKRRKSWLVVQGRFKQGLSFADVLSGQQFDRALRDIPGEIFLKAILKLAKTLNPTATHQLRPNPHFLTNLIATAQVVNVAIPGREPEITDVLEDMRLVNPSLRDEKGRPLSALLRKRLVLQEALPATCRFDTEHVWTFGFWQHLLDLSTYQLDLTIKRLNLLHYLDGQPLRIMARHVDGRKLWNFEIWHRDLLL